MRTLLLRFLRVPCGDYGGTQAPRRTDGQFNLAGAPEPRWCTKTFGHRDSCTYEPGDQPLLRERLRAKGYEVQ